MSVQSAHNSPVIPASGQGLRIGVFDSGVGGLSVLKAIRQQLPLADLIYVADSANAPYGERDDAFISDRCHAISKFLNQQHVDGIVVACNTATAIAVQGLRAALPDMPIIGVEPGIKPGIAQSKSKRVGVLATPGTMASAKFKALVDAHGREATLVLQPCPGLAKEIESGSLDRPELQALIRQFCAPLIEAHVDTVVLGCTHYPFATHLFRQALGPDVGLLDTADAVARRTAELLHPRQGVSPETERSQPHIELWTTGSADHLASVSSNWLGWPLQAQELKY
jgi:glutamate racemase